MHDITQLWEMCIIGKEEEPLPPNFFQSDPRGHALLIIASETFDVKLLSNG